MQMHVQLEVKEGALRFHDLDDRVVRSDAVRLALGHVFRTSNVNASCSVTYLGDMLNPKIQLVVARLKWEEEERRSVARLLDAQSTDQ